MKRLPIETQLFYQRRTVGSGQALNRSWRCSRRRRDRTSRGQALTWAGKVTGCMNNTGLKMFKQRVGSTLVRMSIFLGGSSITFLHSVGVPCWVMLIIRVLNNWFCLQYFALMGHLFLSFAVLLLFLFFPLMVGVRGHMATGAPVPTAGAAVLAKGPHV